MRKANVNLYSKGSNTFLKIDGLEQLKINISDDPFITNSMAYMGALMVTFGKWSSPKLIVCYTANPIQGSLSANKNTLMEKDE